MTNILSNVVKYAGVVALIGVLFIGSKFVPISFSGSPSFGAVGNLKIENYDPYVMYNSGINSALPISTSGLITSTGGLNVTGGATVNGILTLNTAAAGTGTQFQVVRNTFVASATSTPCSNQSPFAATSTILNSTFTPTSATSSVYQFFISTSSTAFATTSAFFTGSQVASGMATFSTGETATTTGYGVIVYPNGYVNLGWSNVTGISPWVSGTCTTIFEQIN